MKKCYSALTPKRYRALIMLPALLIAAKGLTAADNPNRNCSGVFAYAYGHILFEPTPPVINLTVAVLQQNEIQLQWHISNTSNIAHFEVQHSSNGRSFNAIGIVKLRLSGDSAQCAYSFQHLQPQRGRNFYRIKTVYLNKSNEKSAIIPVNLQEYEDSVPTARVAPVKGKKMICFSGDGQETTTYSLFLFDLDGRLVSRKDMPARQTTMFTSPNRGIYLFEIFKNDDRIDQGQLVVD